MVAVFQDIKYAVRQLRKSPGFTVVAVLSLALGIGANTAIFSGLNAVLLRRLPVHNPQALRLINWVGHNPTLNSYTGFDTKELAGGLKMGTSFPYPAFRDFRDHAQGFDEVFAYFMKRKGATTIARGQASVTGTMLVSGNFFAGYGINAMMGRSLLPDDDRPDATPVAVITHRWWKRHWGLDPEVLGQTITLNRRSYTVVGVLPQHYVSPIAGDPTDIYVPMSAQPHLEPNRGLDSPRRWWVQVMGRLAPGVNEQQAQASLTPLFQNVLSQSDSAMEQPGILLRDGSRGPLMFRQLLAKPFIALTIVVGLVLLIACANLAGLLLARGTARQHEMAIRVAVGAGRWQLMRQSLTESLVLSLLGGGFGLMVAALGKQWLLGFIAYVPEGFEFDLRLDSHVLIFTLGLSVLTALVFGLLPAFMAARIEPLAGLKSRLGMSRSHLRLGKVLVAAQVGLSVLLAVGAGLMVRSFAKLSQVDPGFDPENVLLFRLDPSQAGYRDQALINFYDQTHTAILAIPGVRSVACSSNALASNAYSNTSIAILGRDKQPGEDWQAMEMNVSENFFDTMSIPLRHGRDFSITDTATAPPVVVVNETFVRRFFPDTFPIDQTIQVHDGTQRNFRVIGVCRDAVYGQMRSDIPPVVYLAQRQRVQGHACYELRTALPPLTLVPAVRKAIASIDATLPLTRVKTQVQQIDQSIAPDKLFASLGSMLACLGLVLSCIGLYCLMAYNMAHRTREIGIRMALGATPAKVANPVLREAIFLTTIGLVVGLPIALGLAQLIKSQLYGVAPTDPVTIAGVCFLLAGVALLAAWMPARRAAKIDPMEALRYE